MSSSRTAAIAAARPHLEEALKAVPSHIPVALNIGAMVDDILSAAHPDLVRLPRHRSDEEKQTAYLLHEDDDGIRTRLSFSSTPVDGLTPPIVTLSEDWEMSTLQGLREVTVGTTTKTGASMSVSLSVDQLRLICLAGLALADHCAQQTTLTS